MLETRRRQSCTASSDVVASRDRSSPHTWRDDYFPCLAYGCSGLRWPATSTRNLQEGDYGPWAASFLVRGDHLIPLSILFTGASLETMKTTVVLIALPLPRHFTGEVGGLYSSLAKQDYA
ncbi:hypothetical protein ACNKHM_25125 [Shigella sonnei]